MDDASTSLTLALRFLAGAQAALDSGGFDAAHANATVAAGAAVRVLAADRSGSPPDHAPRTILLVDTAEANGQLPDDIASELRALLEGHGPGPFQSVDRDEAAHARRLASRVTALAARRLSHHRFGRPRHDLYDGPHAEARR